MTANLPASTSSVNFGPKDQSDDSYPGKQPELADPFEFERRVVNAYRLLGYNVHRVRIVGGVSVDIVLERGVERTPVMLRTSMAKQIDELRRDAIRLKGLKANDVYSATPVIVVRQFASLATRNWAQHQTDVTIVSLADLESQAAKMQPAPDFEFAFFDKEMARSLAIAEQTQIRDELIGQLLRHDEDANAFSPSGFEALCMKVFAFLFDPNLFGFEAQSQTSDGANRYDFICADRARSSLLGHAAHGLQDEGIALRVQELHRSDNGRSDLLDRTLSLFWRAANRLFPHRAQGWR